MKRIALFFAIILLFIPFNARAIEKITLREAIELALKENPGIKAFTWTIEASKADISIEKSLYYPKLRMEERFLRTDNPTLSFMAKLNQERFEQADFYIDSLNNPDPVTDFQTSFTFEQPLYTPQTPLRIEIAKGSLRAKNLEFERKKEEVALKVIKAYLDVQKAHAYVDISKKAIGDAEEHRRLARVRYENGLGLYSDVLRAEVALKAAQKRLTASRVSLSIAQKALGLLLGKTEPFDVYDDKPYLVLDPKELYLKAMSQRKDLLFYIENERTASKAIELENASLLPEVGIGGGYQINDHNSPFGSEGSSYMVTVFLRWSFFDPTNWAKIKKAEAKAKEISEYRKGLEKEIGFRIHAAYERVLEKKKALELEEASLKEAEEALRLVERRYENSLSPMVDLLDTQLMLDTARARLVDAEKEYLSAIAELYYESGILMQRINELLGGDGL